MAKLRDTIYMENTEVDPKTGKRHHKFYEMEDNGNGTWTARWGKIGTSGVTQPYPIKVWSDKYNEKIRKGYKEIPTPAHKTKPANKPVPDDTVNKRQLALVNKLIVVLTNAFSVPHSTWKQLSQSDLTALKNYKAYLENNGSLTSVQMIHMNNIYKALKKIIPDLDIKEK